MTGTWLRRVLVVATCASAVLLAACGSSSTESAIAPKRFVAFGDGFADIGQNGSRYTVNDGSINNWTLDVANRFDGGTFAPVSAGGTSYARGNARVAAKPDAAGNAATLTVTGQIDAFLAGGKFADNDLVFLQGGISDVIAETAAFRAGTITADQVVANSRKAGRDLAVQARRLVAAGAKNVVLSGTYDLSRTPWAKFIGQESLLNRASAAFNEGLLIDIVDLGANLLYVDAAFYINTLVGDPGANNFDNATSVACNSIDPGPGIGIGPNEVNSSRCTTGTLGVANYNRVIFADNVYLTPAAHSLFGIYAYDRVRNRF